MVSKREARKLKKKGAPKISLTKLSSKRLNKLAKQGKLKKSLAKNRLLTLCKERLHPETMLGLDEVEEPTEAPVQDIPLQEADYEYFATPGRDFSFLSDLGDRRPVESKRKRKKKAVDEAAETFEKRPRKVLGSEKEVKPLLPIKSKQRGLIPRSMEAENHKEEQDEDEVDAVPVAEPLPALSTAQLFQLRRQKLTERKQRIALLASAIIEDPEEHVSNLKELREYLVERDPDIYVTVRKMSLLSLMEVFRDIIPDYRIRQSTEKEKQQQAKKETRKLRDFEGSLLANYQKYLEIMECMAQGKPVKYKMKGKVNAVKDIYIPPAATKNFQELSLHCLCELLVTHPHFNFRTNIIAVIVPFINSGDSNLSDKVCECVRKLFKEDKEGDVTLEVVRLIGRIVKARKFNVKPKILKTFLTLKIKEVETPDDKQNEKVAKREKYRSMSRRDRKRSKQMGQLEKELETASAKDDKRKRLKLHTEIINMVFLTYFRILKRARHSKLLASVLEGLAKFAHLINIDFFDDLFNVLNELVDSGDLSYRESLHCVLTAFTILSGQGAALTIDPIRFYTHLYKTLFQLRMGHSSEDLSLAIECLDIMIRKRRKQVTHQRILAYMKRVTCLALQLNTHGALAALATTRGFIHSHAKSDVMLETENQGSGVYLPELDAPEHCNAHNTALYELHLIRHHFHPTVRRYCEHLLAGAPSQGVGQLPADLCRKTPVELLQEYDPTEMTFKPVIDEKPKSSKKANVLSRREFLQDSISQDVRKALSAAESLELPQIKMDKWKMQK